MVVAFGDIQLFVILVDILPDDFPFTEIKGRSLNFTEPSVKILLRVEGGNLLTVYLQFLMKNVLFKMA